ncbi:lipase chaperone [Paractinoplanes atraurantiacus]|uniref:Uncharacterized protein n=1 Tax=Paractinoplanes atraurantiacus TaxID=1036182 RepID=A0A285KLI1_9ACTN|nr:lipase chaperone [Actinoplanes atraurantiacus]SNY73073.1 hypothetical protein SAMN05421748_14521 [Actinoplanes atraurantiacus]
MDGPGSQQQHALDETAGWPRISDYWPDTPDTPGTPGGDSDEPYPRPETRRKPRHLALIAGVAGVVVLIVVTGVVLLRMATTSDRTPAAAPNPEIVVPSPSAPVSIEPAPVSPSATTPSAAASQAPLSPPPAPSSPAATSKPPSGPAFPAATFVLAGGMRELNVTVGRPPTNGIARVSTPGDSSVTPDATLKGTTLTLTTKENDQEGEAVVDVMLDERIAWTIKTVHGVRRATFTMAEGKVGGFDLQGGANSFEMTLPRQDAEIPLRMSGGVNSWKIRTEGSFPVKLIVAKGIGESNLNGRRDQDLAPGDTRQSDGDDSSGGLKIDAVGGVGTLEVKPL